MFEKLLNKIDTLAINLSTYPKNIDSDTIYSTRLFTEIIFSNLELSQKSELIDVAFRRLKDFSDIIDFARIGRMVDALFLVDKTSEDMFKKFVVDTINRNYDKTNSDSFQMGLRRGFTSDGSSPNDELYPAVLHAIATIDKDVDVYDFIEKQIFSIFIKPEFSGKGGNLNFIRELSVVLFNRMRELKLDLNYKIKTMASDKLGNSLALHYETSVFFGYIYKKPVCNSQPTIETATYKELSTLEKRFNVDGEEERKEGEPDFSGCVIKKDEMDIDFSKDFSILDKSLGETLFEILNEDDIIEVKRKNFIAALINYHHKPKDKKIVYWEVINDEILETIKKEHDATKAGQYKLSFERIIKYYNDDKIEILKSYLQQLNIVEGPIGGNSLKRASKDDKTSTLSSGAYKKLRSGLSEEEHDRTSARDSYPLPFTPLKPTSSHGIPTRIGRTAGLMRMPSVNLFDTLKNLLESKIPMSEKMKNFSQITTSALQKQRDAITLYNLDELFAIFEKELEKDEREGSITKEDKKTLTEIFESRISRLKFQNSGLLYNKDIILLRKTEAFRDYLNLPETRIDSKPFIADYTINASVLYCLFKAPLHREVNKALVIKKLLELESETDLNFKIDKFIYEVFNSNRSQEEQKSLKEFLFTYGILPEDTLIINQRFDKAILNIASGLKVEICPSKLFDTVTSLQSFGITDWNTALEDGNSILFHAFLHDELSLAEDIVANNGDVKTFISEVASHAKRDEFRVILLNRLISFVMDIGCYGYLKEIETAFIEQLDKEMATISSKKSSKLAYKTHSVREREESLKSNLVALSKSCLKEKDFNIQDSKNWSLPYYIFLTKNTDYLTLLNDDNFNPRIVVRNFVNDECHSEGYSTLFHFIQFMNMLPSFKHCPLTTKEELLNEVKTKLIKSLIHECTREEDIEFGLPTPPSPPIHDRDLERILAALELPKLHEGPARK